jgi:hypothetical protein
MAGIVQTGGDAFQPGFQLFFGGQVELVFGGENVGIGRESELNQGIVFAVCSEGAFAIGPTASAQSKKYGRRTCKV